MHTNKNNKIKMLIPFFIFKFMLLSSFGFNLKKEDLRNLNYLDLECDYEFYLSLKHPPLEFEIAYEDEENEIEYYLADLF